VATAQQHRRPAGNRPRGGRRGGAQNGHTPVRDADDVRPAPGTSGLNDLAKFQAAYELIEPLTRHFNFHIIKETRGGLSDFPPNLDKAKGHLAVSTYWQMYMEPDIVHVVSFSEAHHEAKAEDVIESCDIVKQVIGDFYRDDRPDIWHDPRLVDRKRKLKLGAMYNILHLALLGGYEGPVTLDNFFGWAVSPEDARKRDHPKEWERNYETMLLSLVDEANYPTGQCGMISADTLDLALQAGLFQAPQITVLDKRYEIVGKCRTKIANGGCVIDEFNGVKVADELERVDLVRQRSPWFFDKSISQADEDLYITEVAEAIDESVLAEPGGRWGSRTPPTWRTSGSWWWTLAVRSPRSAPLTPRRRNSTCTMCPPSSRTCASRWPTGWACRKNANSGAIGSPGAGDGRIRYQAALFERQGRAEDGDGIHGQGRERLCRGAGSAHRRGQADQQLRGQAD